MPIPLVRGDGITRELGSNERTPGSIGSIVANATVGTVALKGSEVAAGIINRTGSVAGYADTFPTADAICAAFGPTPNVPSNLPSVGGAQIGYGDGAKVGTMYPLIIIEASGNTDTVAAPTNGGITLSGTTAVTASTARLYTVTIVNATPPQNYIVSAVTGQKVYTGLTQAQTRLLQPGMRVYGTSVGTSSRIVSVQDGVGFTVDVNTTGTITNGLVNITPEVAIAGVCSMSP